MAVVDIFLKEKNVLMMVALREKNRRWYVSLLAKEADVTYPHAVHIVRKLEEAGLIRTVKEGRTRYVELTDLGEEVAIALENAYRQLIRISSERNK